MIIYIIIFAYLLLGYLIWRIATQPLGGKKGYYDYIEERYDHPKAITTVAEIAVITAWPYFIIWSILGGNKDEDTE